MGHTCLVDSGRGRCFGGFAGVAPVLLSMLLVAALLAGCRQDARTGPQDADPDGGDVPDAAGDAGTDADSGPSLPEGITALDGIVPGSPVADLAPLLRLVGEAEVVALGESVHTSGGYYLAKHRLIRALVEEAGFRAVAFESPWEAAEQVATYVDTCQGDPQAAVEAGLFGVWASQEVLDLVTWMCDWNEAHPGDRLVFFGFDIQQPWHDGPALEAFIGEALPDQAGALTPSVRLCNGADAPSEAAYYSDPDATEVDESEHAACLAALEDTEDLLAEREDALSATLGEEALGWGRVRLAGLRAWENEIYYLETDPAASYESRDEGMTIVFQAMRALRHPGLRTALWAHNWHIARASDQMQVQQAPVRSMGTFLAELLGTGYVAVGQCALQIFIDWPGVGQGPADGPHRTDSVEHRLAALGPPWLFVDLAFPGAEAPFLPQETLLELGWYFMEPADQFDALVFHAVSEAMEPLLW